MSTQFCEDILNGPRRYPQRAVRISSTGCEDILVFNAPYHARSCIALEAVGKRG